MSKTGSGGSKARMSAEVIGGRGNEPMPRQPNRAQGAFLLQRFTAPRETNPHLFYYGFAKQSSSP